MQKLLLFFSIIIITTSCSLFKRKPKCTSEPLYKDGTVVVIKSKDTTEMVYIHKAWRNEGLHPDKPYCQWNYSVERIPQVKSQLVEYWMDGTREVLHVEYTKTWKFWVFEEEIIMELFDFN